MKKVFLAFLLIGFFTQSVTAQNEEGKFVVYIEDFTCPSNISKTWKEALRNKVIEGIQGMNRVELRDVASEENLEKEAERRKEASAMADETARTAEMRTLGANYIITGDISSMEGTRKTDDKGNVSYRGAIKWTIKVIDASNGTLKVTQSFDHSGIAASSGETAEKAVLATCDYARVSMEDFVDDTFPLEGSILKVETTDKKGSKAQTVYIDLGSLRGIMKGQKFTVYLETDIAGEIARTEIGSLNAQEVVSGRRTLCKVTKGGEEVLKAMNNGMKMIVISRKTRTLLDKIL